MYLIAMAIVFISVIILHFTFFVIGGSGSHIG